MPALYAGKRVGKPLLNGHTYNALFNGKLVWPLDKDTVVSIEITDDKGKPLPKSLAVSGTLKLGAKATYADGHVGDLLTTKNVTFTSRDTSTATVSGNTSITITAGSIVKTIPVSVWGNKWVLPTLPATRNGITFTEAGDGMVHAKGTATDWATILVTQDLPAGEYTLEHTLADGVGPFCELKSTDGRIDLFSHGTVKATIPAGDYQMLVGVSPGKTVDATITPILRKLN